MTADGAAKDDRPPWEIDGRHINAPDWPWSVAGWTLVTLLALLFLFAAFS